MRNRATSAARRTVRVGFGVLAGTLGAVGAVTAGPAVVVVALFAAVVGGLIGLVLARCPGDLVARRTPVADPVMTGAVLGPCAVLLLAGLAVLAGAAAAPIVATVPVLALWRRLRAPGTGTVGAEQDGSDPCGTLAALSDAELARAWRCSHGRLCRARDGAELGRVSALRRRQLDEMERRDPVGFRRWVGSGTWVTGDSAPFLRR